MGIRKIAQWKIKRRLSGDFFRLSFQAYLPGLALGQEFHVQGAHVQKYLNFAYPGPYRNLEIAMDFAVCILEVRRR
jgi:hypothetical protein